MLLDLNCCIYVCIGVWIENGFDTIIILASTLEFRIVTYKIMKQVLVCLFIIANHQLSTHNKRKTKQWDTRRLYWKLTEKHTIELSIKHKK